MGANEFALKTPAPEEALANVLRQAQWLGKGKPTLSEPTAPAASATRPPEPAAPASSPVAPNAQPTPTATATMTAEKDEVVVHLGDRRWRVRGLAKNTAPDQMRLNLFVSREGAGFHVDAVDLYSARQRAQYIALASSELAIDETIIKRDLGELLLKLEDLRDQQNGKADAAVTAHKMTEPEEQAALALLRDPDLLGRILEDFERCGVVGENDNKLLGYLAAVSRKLPRPLGIIVQSSSAAGKSSLLDAILDFVPEEDRLSFSAMTGQSLFYMGSADLAHKIVAVAEHQGAARAAYALKLLQSEGRLVIASTGKDPTTGRLTSHEYRVEGPVALFMTTTGDVDEELLNRCLVLALDEGAEQTRAIHHRQRRAQTLEDLFAREERQHIVQLHRNAQRLLRPLHVVNPFAAELPFAGCRVRSRRDHPKYLALIASLALLHQYQRPVKTAERGGRSIQYIEVTPDDVATADRLAHSVLAIDADDLPPITRRLLGQLDTIVGDMARQTGITRSQVRFTRREVRERLGIGGTQLWHHLRRLVDAEHVVAHPSRHGRGTVYALAYAPTKGSIRGREDVHSGDIRHGFGERSGQVRVPMTAQAPTNSPRLTQPAPPMPRTRSRGTECRSHRTHIPRRIRVADAEADQEADATAPRARGAGLLGASVPRSVARQELLGSHGGQSGELPASLRCLVRSPQHHAPARSDEAHPRPLPAAPLSSPPAGERQASDLRFAGARAHARARALQVADEAKRPALESSERDRDAQAGAPPAQARPQRG